MQIWSALRGYERGESSEGRGEDADALGRMAMRDRLNIGFNVIGYISSNLGLGAAARNYIRLLLERGHEVAAFDLDPGANRAGLDTTYASLTVARAADLPHPVN